MKQFLAQHSSFRFASIVAFIYLVLGFVSNLGDSCFSIRFDGTDSNLFCSLGALTYGILVEPLDYFPNFFWEFFLPDIESKTFDIIAMLWLTLFLFFVVYFIHRFIRFLRK